MHREESRIIINRFQLISQKKKLSQRKNGQKNIVPQIDVEVYEKDNFDIDHDAFHR